MHKHDWHVAMYGGGTKFLRCDCRARAIRHEGGMIKAVTSSKWLAEWDRACGRQAVMDREG